MAQIKADLSNLNVQLINSTITAPVEIYIAQDEVRVTVICGGAIAAYQFSITLADLEIRFTERQFTAGDGVTMSSRTLHDFRSPEQQIQAAIAAQE